MTEIHTPRRRRWFRRVVIVGIALALLVLLVRTGVDLWASSRVEAQLEKLEAQHGKLDASTLRLPPVPEEDNRARAVRAAAALVVGHDEVQALLKQVLTQRPPAPVPAGLQALLDANRAALRVADEARGRRLSNWEVDYPAVNYSQGLAEVRRLSNVLYLEARMALDAARPDEAARALATGLALAASFRQEPSLVTQLIRCAIALQHYEGVQRLLTESESSAPALEILAAALDENRSPSPMHLGLIGELKTFHAAIGRSVDGEGGLWPGRGSWLSRPLFRLAHAEYLESIGRLLDLELGPRPRPEPSAEQPRRWSLIPGAIASGAAGLERAMVTGDLHHTSLAMTELAVALRRYRLAHGEYPNDLAALAPMYVATIPSDALTGKVPSYAREGSGFTLKSEHTKDLERQTSATLAWSVAR
jgi:hypothetical protein